MKILVPIKLAIDANTKVRVKPDRSGVDLSNLKLSINPFCEIAVEAAVRLKEAGKASEVVVVSIGAPKSADAIRTALSIGADRGILIEAEGRVEPLTVAKLLARVVAEEQPGLVITGKQSIDDDSNQTGQMLAALLDWPQATLASAVVLDGEHLSVTREVDGGLQTLGLSLPAVVTTDLRLNEPRYPTLPNIMKAKKKPIETRTPDAYGVDVTPRLSIVEVREPAARKAGIKVASAQELVSQLRSAGVL
ncbi:electron transfer flavoprotein subunit beta/FixA family protein [Sphingobium aquiterrae]|uniref:electron transfer flavoprotein subunit beta/FixA family protein n=1 Tax=Sphingobium aquiterrae TaxID=2038656 RepID=UPI0030198E13